MGLRGDLSKLQGLRARLRALPVTVAHDVAQRAAPAMTGLTQQAFDSGVTVYGEARPDGATGPLTLEKTGHTRRTLRFESTGTIVRCVLTAKYQRYLIGKYSVLPNGALPAEWARKLAELVRATRVSL
jgi:hypothetical protein